MRILYVAGREESYSRTRIVFKALKKQGFEVFGCFPPDKSFKHYPALIWRAVRLGWRCDMIIVGFYGQLILPFIKLLTWKPIIFDMYIATFDTMVNDRSHAVPGSLKARFYRWSDIIACKLSYRLILETYDHIRDFGQKFQVSEAKFKRLFLAVDDSVIYPREKTAHHPDFLVHFHGEYAPFHGVKYILQAADLLREQNVSFQIIGRGITYEADQKLAKELRLTNVIFLDPVPYDKLADSMARADVCLGIFGDNDRMLRVLTNKVIESIGMQKPLITGRNAPVQELLCHKQSVYLVDRANARALADAILTLKEDEELREKIALGGYRVFLQYCTLDKFGQGLAELVKDVSSNGC
ncbi:glycosyltransferase [candidate division KSB1 bacterium]|nr:glycosyltransferase [candidate division KSB1 bacterium]RQW06302.1 MAG: glycosyltransferase [candidate division KSB1 bacterium]